MYKDKYEFLFFTYTRRYKMREAIRNLLIPVMVLMMVFAFAGCTDSGNSEDPTEPTEETATEATEPTEAPDDYDIMEGSEMTDGGDVMLLYGNDFLMLMPKNDSWGYEQTSKTSVEFYLKSAREDGFGGNVVTIMAFDPDDTSYEDFPDYTVAGHGANVDKTFIALFPTDVQFNPEDNEQQAAYNDLYDYVKKINENDPHSPFQNRDSD
jgi:hypothetical protein